MLRPLLLLRIFPLVRRLRELQRAVHQARSAAKDLRGDDAGDAYARVLTPALDRAISQMLHRAAAKSARRMMEASLDGDWQRLGKRSQDLMIAAEVLRSDLQQYASIDPRFDFASAIHAYSRALENTVLEKLFEPFPGSDPPLPAETGDPRLDMSLEALRRLQAKIGPPPELGTMAHCLRNVGCRLADAPDNGFAGMLDQLLLNREAFCAEFPRRLMSYTDKYRNRAAHIDRMSLEQCEQARAVLLDEPVRLIHMLISSLRVGATV